MVQHAQNKAVIARLWTALDTPAPEGAAILNETLDDALIWQGMDPVGPLTGRDAFLEEFWLPFRASFEDFQRRTHIFLAGASNGRADGTGSEGNWVAGTGYFTGRQTGRFLGIDGQGAEIRVRWAEFARVENGRVVFCQFMVDIVDWCAQLGTMLLPPSRGAAFVYPAPTGVDGVEIDGNDTPTTDQTMSLGRDLIFGGLNVFDEDDLSSMGMRRFFHPNLKWYGPGGINACLSLDEFETFHQRPWLTAFPDRKVQDLESLFAEGPFLAASGVEGVLATHSGPYLGHAPQGRPLRISGLDFWLRSGDRFTENWVFVDMVRLFAQMGYDILKPLERG